MSNSTPLIRTSAHLMIRDWQICRLLLTSAEDMVKQIQYLYKGRTRNTIRKKSKMYSSFATTVSQFKICDFSGENFKGFEVL